MQWHWDVIRPSAAESRDAAWWSHVHVVVVIVQDPTTAGREPPPHDLITWQESDCHVMGRSAFTLSERVLIKLAPNITKKSRNSRGYSDFEPLESPSCRTRFRRFFSRPRVRFETEPRIHGWMPSHSATDRISIQVNTFRPADAGYTLLYISFKIVAERCRSSLCPSSGRNVTMPVPINTLLSCSSKCRT